METLSEYLKTHQPSGFNPAPFYSPHGDSLTFLFQDRPYFAERIDDFLTVYRAQTSDELIGCQIKGVTHACELLGDFGITMASDQVRLSLLFFALLQASDSERAEHFYFELSKSAKNASISKRELEAALN